MLITKEVSVEITNRNKFYYNKLGHSCSSGDIIHIKIDDLYNGSNMIVECLCDYCLKEGIETILPKQYYKYNKEREKFPSDTCYKHRYEKEYDKLKYKNDNGLLTISDRRYYTFKENRLKGLKNYIEKFGTITNMRKNNKYLYKEILRNKETPTSLAEEMGYNIFEICDKLTPHYLDDWNKFETQIRILINKFNRFPTIVEITKELGIGQQYINYHGGIYDIKRKLNYVDEGDLIDDSGYYNSSSYEYIFSQWILNNSYVKVDRNVLISDNPKEDGNYNCDFVLSLQNDTKLWVEIWGGYRSKSKDQFHNYNETHDIKIKLYDKHKHNLISIYPEFFDNKKYEEIQTALYELFSDKIECIHKNIDVEKIIPYTLIDEQELIDKIMSYSTNDEYLPTVKVVEKANNRLMREIVKRYGNYGKFSKKIGMPMEFKTNKYWDEDKIFEYFGLLHDKYNKLLNRPEIQKLKDKCILCRDLSRVITVMHKYGGGFRNMQLTYFMNNINEVSNEDILLLNRIADNKINDNTPEHQLLAKQILEKYNKQQPA